MVKIHKCSSSRYNVTKALFIISLIMVAITATGCDQWLKIVLGPLGIILPTKYLEVDPCDSQGGEKNYYNAGETVYIDVDAYASWLYGIEPLHIWVEDRHGYHVYDEYRKVDISYAERLSWQATSSGYYTAAGCWVEDKKGGKEVTGDNEAREAFYAEGSSGGGATCTYYLDKWSGNNTTIQKSSALKYPLAQKIVVEVKGVSIPAIIRVTFNTDRGQFENSSQEITKNVSQITTFEGEKYLAGVIFMAPSDVSISEQITISCKLTDYPDKLPATFRVYCINDAEKTNLILDDVKYTHQKNPPDATLADFEAPGDNMLDDNEAAPSNTIKNISIELDWYQWRTGIVKADIDEIKGYVETTLKTAGLQPDILVSDEYIKADDPLYQFSVRREILAASQSQKTRLHVIIGTVPSDLGSKACGLTQGYFTTMDPAQNITNEELYYSYTCGSGPTAMTDNKKYVGCFVFPTRIEALQRSTTISWKEAIAMAVAHEIGHAMGMGHVNYDGVSSVDKNIMHTTLGDMINESFFSTYGKFYLPSLDGTGDYNEKTWDGMNARHVLGIDCVDIREEELP